MRDRMPHGSLPPEISRELPRSPDAPLIPRNLLRQLLSCGVATGEAVENAQLVVSELVTNALRHGDGAIQLRVRLAHTTARIEVVDEGVGNVAAVHPRPPGEAGGWGLHIVEQLSERWGVFSGTTHVWAKLSLVLGA